MSNAITIKDTGSSSTSGEDSQAIITGTPTAGSVAAVTAQNYGSVGISISGTWTGTLAFEQSPDNINNVAVDAFQDGVDDAIQSTTANGVFKVDCAANATTRVRATANMTGTAIVAFTVGGQTDLQHVVVVNASAITIGSFQGVDANGVAPTGKPVLQAGWDATDVRTMLTDSTGRQRVVPEGNLDTAALITLAAAGASTVNSADQTNNSGRGVVLGINLATVTTATVTINIQGKDAASGQYYTILSTTALAVAGFSTLTIYPSMAVSANVSASAPLPKTWRAQAVITGGSAAVTGTVGASVIE